MIRSFAYRETERVWQGFRSRKLPPDIQDKALVKLRLLNRSVRLDECRREIISRRSRVTGAGSIRSG